MRLTVFVGVLQFVITSAAGAQWRADEAGALADHAQLTFPSRFAKAGEAYFDANARWVIFQAVPAGAHNETGDETGDQTGAETGEHYSMYVAKVRRDEGGAIAGLHEPILLSAQGAATTCGFFHPVEPWRVIFGSTLVAPSAQNRAGYQRGSGRYAWAFPTEMEIVGQNVAEIFEDYAHELQAGVWNESTPLWTREGYDAEGSHSPDGRFIVHTRVDDATGDADIWVWDDKVKQAAPLVTEKGYDGGPFFSPDGKRICYRSDRKGDNLLQLFVADLAFGPGGEITGVRQETQLTDNAHVNWAPFWRPSGGSLVYATSEAGHDNYEVFSIEVDTRKAPSALKKQRITHAAGFDGLPVFSRDGAWMMWTSQRGEGGSSQLWAARVVDVAP